MGGGGPGRGMEKYRRTTDDNNTGPPSSEKMAGWPSAIDSDEMGSQRAYTGYPLLLPERSFIKSKLTLHEHRF